VSALGSVHTLDISGCRAIQDVSMLGGVKVLSIRYCNQFADKDLVALNTCQTLYAGKIPKLLHPEKTLKGVESLIFNRGLHPAEAGRG
jgi:hypothetical protein